MKKVVEFLEKYAEYLAMGIAVLFLGLVVWSYVLDGEALKSKVGGEQVFPGEVDAKITRTALPRLEGAVGTKLTKEIEPRFAVKDFGGLITREMGPQRSSMASGTLTTPYMPGVPNERRIEEGPKIELGNVKALPVPPAALAVRAASGQSLVVPPPNPNDPNNPGGAPAPGQPNVKDATDISWDTHVWKIDMTQLAAAWRAQLNPDKLPPEALSTIVLNVEVEREELIAPGKWSNRNIIKPLQLIKPEIEWPASGKFGDVTKEEEYRIWAEKHQVDILLPPFYQVVKGHDWVRRVNGQDDLEHAPVAEAQPGDAQPFDPANPPTDRPLTDKEKQLVYKYKQQQKEEEARQKAMEKRNDNKNPPRGNPAGGGGGRRGGGAGPGAMINPGMNPLAVALFGAVAAEDNSGRVRGVPGAVPGRAAGPAAGAPINRRGERSPERAVVSPEMPAANPGGEIGAAGTGQFATNPLLSGPFNPIDAAEGRVAGGGGEGNVAAGTAVKEITFFSHDVNVEPGKTYRYRVRYSLKNPIFLTKGINDKLADQFVISSTWSDWQEVTIPSDTQFYFASQKQAIQGGVLWVTVDVFKRVKGQWTKETFQLTPGDSIGQARGGVDFDTGFTVVDLRKDIRDVRIIYTDPRGELRQISLQEHLNDPQRKKLLDMINAPKPPDGGGAGEGAVAPAIFEGAPR